MAYLAFYRTFRPTTFDEVVRQEHIVRILKNQIESDKIGHAYLFCGPRGTGKTTLAKIFARAINCENPVNGSPCGKCATCRALASGSALDISEIDAASNNGVDEMRDLREKVQYPPVNGRYKVYIIDEVHMLTQSAFNAVLKTLEEPPHHAVFILATTEPQKIPATILSRCMRFDFKLIPQTDLENLIKSVFDRTGKEYEDEAVAAIARAGNGSARDSLSIADMCASYSQGKLTYDDVNAVLGKADFEAIGEIASAIVNQNAGEALTLCEQVLSTGKGVGVLLRDLLSYFNSLAIAKMCRGADKILNLPAEKYAALKATADGADGHSILRATEILSSTESALRYAVDGAITLENAIIKAAMPQADYDIEALLTRIAALEKAVKEGVKVAVKAAQTQVNAAQPVSQSGVNSAPVRPAAEKVETPRAKSGFAPFEEASPFGETASVTKPEKKEQTSSVSSSQNSMFDGAVPSQPAAVGSLSEADKSTLFGRFIRLFRTTRRNAVLFTLCCDLESSFEGDKFILSTPVEAVYKSLNREDNKAFIAETLQTLGVFSYEIRLKPKGEDKYEKAVNELKRNFSGTDITIK